MAGSSRRRLGRLVTEEKNSRVHRSSPPAATSRQKLLVASTMTPAVTETMSQDPGVHFSSSVGLRSPSMEANLCLSNPKSKQYIDPLISSTSGLMHTGNDLYHQKDYNSDHSWSPQYESVFFVNSSVLNVHDKHSPIWKAEKTSSGLNVHHKPSPLWKAEKDTHRQRFCTRAGSRPHFADRKVKRKLFPGSVSQVLADVNKLWDLSVTEAESMPGSPKYRLNGRIEGESLAIPLASHYSSPEVMDLDSQPQNVPDKESNTKSTLLRCLHRQQALVGRVQRNKKHLQLLLANHVVEHCSQQISGFVKDQIKKRKRNISALCKKGNETETNLNALVPSRMDIYEGNNQKKAVKPVVQMFSIPMTEILKSFKGDLDSDATGSSSDEDCDENSRKGYECNAEWKWLSVRAHVGSRWTWLQAQISELEYKIQQAVHFQSEIRNKKGTLVFEEPSDSIFRKRTRLPDPGSPFKPAEWLTTPTADINPSLTKDLEMSPSSPTLLLRNIEKQSAQLTEMVSSLMTALPIMVSPNAVKSFKKENRAVPYRMCTAKTPMFSRSQQWHPMKKRKRICTKVGSTSTSSSARIRPLKLYHKRNLYRLGLGFTAPYSYNGVYCYDESLQTSNLNSTWTSYDKPQQPLLVKSNVCAIDPHFHPILSLASELPLRLYLGGLLKSNSKLKGDVWDSRIYRQEYDDLNMPCPRSVIPLLCHNPHNEKSNGVMANESGAVTLNSFSNGVETETIGTTTPSSQKSSSQIRESSVMGSAQRRRLRSPSSYDIDNIVIPMNLVAPIKLEKLQYKEIMTPSWKEKVYEPLGTVLDEELEDLSDEVFSGRHEKYEERERAHWAFWHHNKWPKRSRSPGTGLGLWPGNAYPSTGETYSLCLSPITHDSSSNSTGAQSTHSADELQQDRIEYWEHRLFPLTEAAAQALVNTHTRLLTKTPPTNEEIQQRSSTNMNNR